MAKTSWSDGDVATAALLNQVEDQIIVVCTSTTRPTGVEGQHIWETDNDRQLVYDGAAWQEQNGLWTQVTSGATAGTNWTINDLYCYVNPVWAFITVVCDRTTSSLTPNAEGDITNETIATLPTSVRGNINKSWPLHSGTVGRVATGGYNPSSGVVTLAASGGASDAIDVGESIELGGYVLLNV